MNQEIEYCACQDPGAYPDIWDGRCADCGRIIIPSELPKDDDQEAHNE